MMARMEVDCDMKKTWKQEARVYNVGSQTQNTGHPTMMRLWGGWKCIVILTNLNVKGRVYHVFRTSLNLL